jgi:hypothetical protein
VDPNPKKMSSDPQHCSKSIKLRIRVQLPVFVDWTDMVPLIRPFFISGIWPYSGFDLPVIRPDNGYPGIRLI